MATTDAKARVLWGVAHRVYFPILDNDGDRVTGAAGLASEVCKDEGGFNDCTYEATELGSSGAYYLDLSAAEMEADCVSVIIKTSTTDAKSTTLVLYTDRGVRSRKAQAGASGSITLDSSGSATDDFYNGCLVEIVGGTGAGQSRIVSDYVGSTKVASVGVNWVTAPDNTSVFRIDALPGVIAANVPANFSSMVIAGSGNVASDLKEVNGDATAAANLAKTTRAIGRGTVGSSASATSIPTSAFAPAGGVADQFKGRIITFDADTTTAALRGQATDITANSNASTPTLTVTALTTAPASGDTFSVT